MKIKIYQAQTPKMKPKIKCNMFCKNIHYMHVMKVPKVPPPPPPPIMCFHPFRDHEWSYKRLCWRHLQHLLATPPAWYVDLGLHKYHAPQLYNAPQFECWTNERIDELKTCHKIQGTKFYSPTNINLAYDNGVNASKSFDQGYESNNSQRSSYVLKNTPCHYIKT